MAPKFSVATASGTFDHFHKGHKQFLLAAFVVADTVYVGITSDRFGKGKRQTDELLPFEDRRQDVELFLNTNGLLPRSHMIELHDIYGPTLDPECPIEAIIVTEKTHYGAELINTLRRKKGLSPLAIEQVAYVNAQDGGDLSSSRIRAKEIDREGNRL